MFDIVRFFFFSPNTKKISLAIQKQLAQPVRIDRVSYLESDFESTLPLKKKIYIHSLAKL